MGWGGARPGSGPKPKNGKRRAKAKPQAKAVAVAAQPRQRPVASVEEILEVIKASSQHARAKAKRPEFDPFKLPDFPPNAIPPTKGLQLAMDSVPEFGWAQSQWQAGILNSAASEGLLFLGYTYLAELAQRPEYRVISETIADDATRKWIDFEIAGTQKGDEGEQADETKHDLAEDRAPEERQEAESPAVRAAREKDKRREKVKASGKADKVKALEDEMERLEVRDRFYSLSRDDGFFGRSHLFMDFGNDDPLELKTPIGNGRDEASKGKVGKGSLRRLQTIEPVWVYPTTYNAQNPMAADWYNPQVWYVMGKEIHKTRIPSFISRPVPDILKPAYAFGGLPMSQLAKPYVDIWLTTRESVGQLIHAFSVMVLETDMQTMLSPGAMGGGAQDILARAAMFNALRDNQGLFLVNKATEGFSNVAAPLSGLHELQAQSQEHMASVSRIPLVKLTGISPSGLNASSEGEIRAYYDTIAAYQNRFFRPELTTLINFMQLSLWGEIDPEIGYVFEPLWEMSEKEKAELQKQQAERDQLYVDMGALAPEEIRKKVIDDPELPFADLDPDDVPDLAEEEEEGLKPAGGKSGEGGGGEGGHLGAVG